jgi:hypothetical protein
LGDIIWRIPIATATNLHKVLGSTDVYGATKFTHRLSIVK